MLSGCLWNAIFNNHQITKRVGKTTREGGDKKTRKKRWKIIASFPNLGDIRPRFSLSAGECVYANYQNTPTP